MWLKLFSRLDEEGKSEVYYQVHGCPHLIAITSMIISDLQNKSIQELEKHNINEYAEIINLPKTKQDRLFVGRCIKRMYKASQEGLIYGTFNYRKCNQKISSKSFK